MEQGQPEQTQVVIVLQPPKAMGSLTFCDTCNKYVAEKCSEATNAECAK